MYVDWVVQTHISSSGLLRSFLSPSYFSKMNTMAANPSNPAELYAALLTTELAGLTSAESLEVIGSLIDISDDLGKSDGARRALELSDILEARKPPELDAALLEYFRANAWSVLRRHQPANPWDWEQPALGKQIFHLRKCVCHAAFPAWISCAGARFSQIWGTAWIQLGALSRHRSIGGRPSFWSPSSV